MMDDLQQLRKNIEAIDERIVDLMIQRNDTAMKIGLLKKDAGIPLRNHDVEKAVIERYRKIAKGTSLSEDAAEAVCKILISASVELQSKVTRKRCSSKMTVIGGSGKMGQWISRYFESMGAEVKIVDISVGDVNDMRGADVVVISVPMSSVGSVLKDADRICRKDTLIFDIASIKTPFSEQIKEMAKRRKVCSVHPMFGPSASSMAGRNVLICDCGCDEAVKEAKELFDNDGANIVITSVERHDELMAYSMAFAHASNIVFFTALRLSGVSMDELKDAASTTFNNTLRTSVPVSKENASLYHAIQSMNDNSGEMWGVYERAFREVMRASLSDDPDKFTELMELGKEYLDHL
ncbi:MAG: prephenate dehydrogenase/arogenate dehydrogenase family protein [Methanomassiliicoccaceae archaeon]|jgi:chorismate mutase/prephenate dehydrogenase|nr:prephenate dehydrogenase/arogenate dehydrogenase family protein [Methanomassiliicoccaceae archaeon]